ncbi:hypothetical protein [Amycolatopsis sp. NBC_01480]|uniref:hypothetical protein n=1 Tax=Amycolatopsis sp. NBC_01480 TaxID=2903562 RepID=UPI002E28DF2D|nr:hypothetical protein [Amycolatopsis sp. NBC_01480]
MAAAITQAQYQAVAKELLANAAEMLAAERRSYATIQGLYDISTSTDAYQHFASVADELDSLATELRS